MEWYVILIGILILLCSVGLVAVIMLQKSDDDGNALMGSVSESSRNNNVRKTGLEAKLPTLTIVFGVAVAVLCLLLAILERLPAAA